MNLVGRLFFSEEGQGLVEYVLIISFIAIALVSALTTLKIGISSSYADSVSKFPK